MSALNSLYACRISLWGIPVVVCIFLFHITRLVSWCFVSAGLDDDKSDREDSESSQSEFEEDAQPTHTVITPPEETNYTINSREELGQVGSPCPRLNSDSAFLFCK